jgi:2'-5' RNA ligase
MAAESEQWRLFVACELPSDALAALRSLQSRLRGRMELGLRWVRPEGMHLTLKFLGNVSRRHVREITEALEQAVLPFEVNVTATHVGMFGGIRPRVVWAGLDGDVERLQALADVVEGALGSVGFPGEGRPFRPHLTLARVPEDLGTVDGRALHAAVQSFAMTQPVEITLREVALMRSVLGPGGARYQRLAEFPRGRRRP